jgi:hypothetical protein
MAKAEGWSTKNGSKWITMPELMLRYRAAAFFARLYAPDITLGMMTAEEVHDVAERDVTPKATESKLFKESPAKSATAGSPPSLRDGQKEAQQNEPAELSLSGDPYPLADQVLDRLNFASLAWSEVYAVMADQGLADPEFVPLNEAPADVLASCLALFGAIVDIVKGGAK